MKRATLVEGCRYQELSFSSYMAGGEGLSDPIISSICGNELDYGKLFAYCFRRFGYPNCGWDDYKELARYLLTTPRNDMLLSVVPYVGNTAAITLRFLVPVEVNGTVEAYARRFQTAWEERSLVWCERQGLPKWMPEWLRFFNGEFRAMFNNSFPEQNDWRQCINFHFAYGQKGSTVNEMTQRVVEFRKELRDEYEKLEPYPEYYTRPAKWEEWDDSDPLKTYAEAAVAALNDLHRPVGVRDSAINAFGKTEIGTRFTKPAAVAGYPSGDLGNKAPKEFAELHKVVLKLGKGNARLGIARVMASVEMSRDISLQTDESGPSP